MLHSDGRAIHIAALMVALSGAGPPRTQVGDLLAETHDPDVANLTSIMGAEIGLKMPGPIGRIGPQLDDVAAVVFLDVSIEKANAADDTVPVRRRNVRIQGLITHAARNGEALHRDEGLAIDRHIPQRVDVAPEARRSRDIEVTKDVRIAGGSEGGISDTDLSLTDI
jgi:hypothetical protein